MRLAFLILMIASLKCSGQAENEKPGERFWDRFKKDSLLSFRSSKGYLPCLIHNLGRQATFPLRLKGNNFEYIAGISAVTGGLILIDERIDKQFKSLKSRSRFLYDFDPRFTELGDYYGYILLAGYGGYTLMFHKYYGFRTALLASQAAITAGTWIRVGKLLSGRMRPGETYNDPEFPHGHWFGPFAQLNSKYNSNRGAGNFDAFPSGHTGAAFAIATVFAKRYKDSKAVPVIVYSLATLVGVSRFVEHDHWASDVFLGGVIGYFCGKEVVNNDNRVFGNEQHRNKIHSSVFPTQQDGINGIGFRMIF
jgi:hypothetical protein